MNNLNQFDEPNNLKRINSSYLVHELKHLFHLEKGFLFTTRELLVRPGKTAKRFIFEDRSKITKPVVFLIFSATIFTLVFHFFHIEYVFFSVKEKVGNIDSYLNKEGIDEWINGHIGYVSIAIGLLISLWLSLFFKKQGFNIYEITVLLCYAIGEALLIITFFTLLSICISFILKLFGVEYRDYIVPMIGVYLSYVYIFWSIGQFFGGKALSFFKSLVCCILGVLSFRSFLLLIAYVIYLIK